MTGPASPKNIISKVLSAILTLSVCAAPAIAAEYQVKKGTSLNTRAGPGTSFERKGRLRGGTTLKEIERKGIWSKVQTPDGRTVWVHNGFIVVKGGKGRDASAGNRNPVSVVPQIGHNNAVRQLVYDPKERILVSLAESETDAIVWDAKSSLILRRLKGVSNDRYTPTISLKPGSPTLVAREGVGVRHFSLITGEKKNVSAHKFFGPLVTDSIDPLGRFIALGYGDSYLPDAKHDRNILLRDLKSGRTVAVFKRQYMANFPGQKHSQGPQWMEFSTDGNWLSAGGRDRIELWSVGTDRRPRHRALNEPTHTYKPDRPDPDSKFSTDDIIGSVLLADGTKALVAWKSGYVAYVNLLTSEELWSYTGAHKKGISKVVLSKSKKHVAIADELNAVSVLKTSDGTIVRTYKSDSLVTELLFDDLEENLFFGHKDGSVQRRPISEEETQAMFAGPMKVRTAAAHPTAPKVLFSMTKGGAYEIDLDSTTIRKIDAFGSSVISSFAYSEFGRKFAAAEWNKKAIRVFDSATYGETLSISTRFPPTIVSFGPNGKSIVAALSKGSSLMLGRAEELGKIEKYNPDTGKRLQTFRTPPNRTNFRVSPNDFAIDPVRNLLIAGYGGMFGDPVATRVSYDFNSSKVRQISKQKSFSVNTQKGSTTYSIEYSSDHQHYLIEESSWRGKKPNEIRIYKRSGRQVARARFDGFIAGGLTRFITGTNKALFVDISGTVNLLAPGQRAKPFLIGHRRVVQRIDFIPKRNLIVTASEDGTVRFWDINTGKQRVAFAVFENGDWIAFTPEGFFHGSPGAQNRVGVASGATALPIRRFYDALYRPDLVREALRGDPDGKVERAARSLNLSTIWHAGLPPTVSKLLSMNGASVAVDKIQLEMEITPTNGGIGRVEVKVNGATQIIENVPSGETSKSPVRIVQSVFLTPGSNRIEVVAYNSKNQISSDAETISVTSTAKQNEKSTLHVLVVGIDAYQNNDYRLNFAVKDANTIANALKSAGTGHYDSVSLTSVLDSKATIENLDAVFDELGKKVRPQDVFVFFLAGHGITTEGRYYFLPYDFDTSRPDAAISSGIGQNKWQEWFARIPAQKSVLLFDTCESGSLTRIAASKGLEDLAAINRLTRATGRTILTASTDTEPALEGLKGHGVFSYAVLSAIGGADNDNDGQLEVTEIAAYIKEQLPKLSEEAFGHRQVPQTSIRGYSFSLGKPVNVFGAP